MVEKQALMEALLQAIADNFDRNDRTKINFVSLLYMLPTCNKMNFCAARC